MIKRIRLHLRQPMHRAGALPVGSYALPNNLPAGCLYHRLHNGVCDHGSTGPLIHRDGAGPLKSIMASYQTANWTWAAWLDFNRQTGL
jgi:hypothetical protein